jgi:hypothetical protein
MKYIITESKLKEVVSKYLDSIDWRVLESTDEEFPIEIYEHTTDKGPTFVVRVITHKYGAENRLYIRELFQIKLEDMFGESTVSGEPNTLVMDWFKKHFNIDIDDYTYMGNHFMMRDN